MPLFILLTAVVLSGPSLGLANGSWLTTAVYGVAFDGMMVDPENPLHEMRASIVDREGDQFIAKTEAGQEFRLPVEGAPDNVQVGDELRLVLNPETHTITVFKADPDARSPDTKNQV